MGLGRFGFRLWGLAFNELKADVVSALVCSCWGSSLSVAPGSPLGSNRLVVGAGRLGTASTNDFLGFCCLFGDSLFHHWGCSSQLR